MAECLEHRPLVQHVVGRDLLRHGERAAAGEHTEPPEHGLLVRREQPVAPLQRGTQRLVTAQHRARAGGQQAEALAQPLAQSFDAHQGQSGDGKLDRERDPVEPPAYLDDRGNVARHELETPVDRACTLDEQRDRAESACVIRRHRRIRIRHRQRAEAEQGLRARPQRFLRRHDEPHHRALREHGVDDGADRVAEVLAVVQHQQHVEVGQGRGQRLGLRAAGREMQPDRARDALRDEIRIGECGELHPPHAIGEAVAKTVGEGKADAGLAHTPGPDDRHQPVRLEECAKVGKLDLATDQCRDRGGHVARRLCRRGGRRRRHGRRRRACFGRGRARDREAIAASRYRRDGLRPEHLAQRADLHLQVVFLDDDAGPDHVQQLGLGDEAIAAFDQCMQNVEGTRAQRHGLPVDEQLAGGRTELEAAEPEVGAHVVARSAVVMPPRINKQARCGTPVSERLRPAKGLKGPVGRKVVPRGGAPAPPDPPGRP